MKAAGLPSTMSKRKNESAGNVEIYCQIRQCQKNNLKWKPLLQQLSSDHSRRCVKTLLKHAAIAEALDPLLSVSGLREGWTLSTVHKIVNMKCDNVRMAPHLLFCSQP